MSGSEEQEDPKVGQLLQGRYRVMRKLGEGGMGAVYEAHHELIGKRLALKCLHPQFLSNKEVVERFHREANAATAVGNEHIIEVSDVGSFDDGSPYMIMEFLEGTEFGDLLEQQGSLPISRLCHIVIQSCDALSAAHDRGIVHRDMKPENIYLVKRGADSDFVKVLDFGISKMKEVNESVSGSLTKTGTALGTPYYMPPEQAQGVRDVDHRADIYAVGVIMYQGLTGRMPFDAESYPALMVKILTETADPILAFRQDVPPELVSVVERAMQKDRDLRFQNCAELAAALRPFLALDQDPVMLASMRPSTGGEETTPFGWSEPTKAQDGSDSAAVPTGGKGKLIGIAAAGLAVVGVVAGLALGGGSGPQPAPAAAGALPPGQQGPQPALPVAPAAPFEPLPSGIAVPPKPTEVQIAIKATPQDARIFIGEVEFPNPMDAWRPRSLDPIRLRVEAKGHRSVEQLAIFDQDRELSFELEKGKGVKRLAALKGGSPTRRSKPAPVVSIKPVLEAPQQAKVEPKPAPKPKPKPEAKPTGAGGGIYKGPSGKIRDEF